MRIVASAGRSPATVDGGCPSTRTDGSTSITRRDARSAAIHASNAVPSPIRGTTARRHCFADAIAIRRQRSGARPAFSGATVCAVTSGSIAATPIIVASRTTSSIFSPLSAACASVTRTAGSGAAAASSTIRATAPSRAICSTRARNSRPAPSKTTTSSPARRRSTCDRWRASSSDRCAVPEAGSIVARKRGSTGST
jgi:hypothetical protein